jgi:hypothetical protein
MQKLVTYISKLKEASQGDVALVPPPRGNVPKIANRSLTVEEVEALAKRLYPDLTGEEEEEIRRCLGISPGAGDTKQLVVDTMKRIASSRNSSVALISKEKEAEEEDDGGGNDFSTFRVSTADDFSGSDDEEAEGIEEMEQHSKSISISISFFPSNSLHTLLCSAFPLFIQLSSFFLPRLIHFKPLPFFL